MSVSLSVKPRDKQTVLAALGYIAFYYSCCVCVYVCTQCDLSVAELLSTPPEPLFYDVFMDLGGEKSRELLPLPTLVYNQQYNGRFINQGAILFFRVCLFVNVQCFNIFYLWTEGMKNWYLSRRIFLVDTLSGREKSMSSLPKVIRMASSIKIR